MNGTMPLGIVRAALACAVALAFAARADATILVPQWGAPKQIAASVYSDGAGPEVAFDGTRFFVVWASGSAVYGAFLDTDGDVISPPGAITITSSDGWRPSVSYDGTGYLVAWRGSAGTGTVLAKRVSSTGAVLDDSPILVASGDVKQRRISVAFDGTRHLAVWRTEGDVIRGARISTAGAPLDGASGFAIGAGFYPGVESAGGKSLVVWHGHGASGLDVYGSLVTNGTPAPPFTIADEVDDQDHVTVAANGTDFMVVFKDRRFADEYNFSGTSAVRVTGAGMVLDNPSIKVSDHQWSQGSIPTVAWDGTHWVIAWAEDKIPVKHRVVDTYLRRVSATGAIVDVDPVPVGTGFFHQLDPTIAVAGARYLALLVDRGRCTYPETCLNVWLVDRLPGTPSVPPAAGPSQPEVGTWQSVTVPTDEAVHGVWAVSDDLAYASTEEGGPGYNSNPLLRWNGSAWSVAAIQPNARKWDVWAAAENRVFSAGGAGGSFVLWDGTNATLGGNLFVDETTSLLGQAMAIRGFGEWNVFAAGMSGAVARHFGSEQLTWQHGACLTLDEQPFAYWGKYDCDYIRAPFGNWDLGGSFPNDVYVVGEHATMARFDGTDWSLVGDLPTQQSLNGVWASCAGDVFAVGDHGTILRRSAGAWTRMGSPTTEHLTAVAGFSPSDVYAVGYGGTILHFDGTSWSPEASGTDNTLEDVAVGGSTAWAVGARQDEWNGVGPGTILRKGRTIADAAPPTNPLLSSRTHAPVAWTSSSALRVEIEGGCDDGRGIDGYSVVLDNEPGTTPPAVENVDRGASYFARAVADGEWYLHLRTVDRAGNWSAPSHLGPLRADATPPTDPSVTTDPAPGTWAKAADAVVSWSGAADGASGVAGYSYSADQSPAAMADTTVDAAASATGATLHIGQGDWYVHVRTVDSAGNWSAGVTAGPLHIDWTPPGNPTATSTSHQPFAPSSDTTIDIALSGATDNQSGVAGFSYAFDQTPPAQPDETVDAGWQTQAVTSLPLADGDWWFHVRTVDLAGNWSGHNAIGPFRIDRSAAPVAPPPLPPARDTTPPAARLAGSTAQRLGDSVRVEVRCTGAEDCRVSATGTLSVPGKAKPYRLSRVSGTRIAAGRKATIKLKLSRRATTAARSALRAGRRVTARVTVVVRDAAGNGRTLRRNVRLRR